MNVVEKVARAIVVFWGEDPDRQTVTGKLMWEETAPLARAAIAAMRTPTSEMCIAGVAHDHVRTVWQAMIDEALREDGPS